METFWALQGVNFQVTPGARLGIIGRNGAGKSTLLKILSRITEPTTGRVRLRGRVGSLLEVGTGFHPELTGKENIFLNGAILGMARSEIDRKFEEIVHFAGVERFLETPVKRYSSGMYVRLAFAVAAHLDPEILVVDEVLAVGDAEFQRKCLGKLEEVGQAGRTVLFVSHNMGAIQQLCSECILLHDGRLQVHGSPSEVVAKYLALGMDVLGERSWPDPKSAPGSSAVRLRSVRVTDSTGDVATEFTVRDPVTVEMEYWVFQDVSYLDASLHFTNERGELLFVSVDDSFDLSGRGRPRRRGFYRARCHIPGDFLNDGLVYVKAGLTAETTVHTVQPSLVMFHVVESTDSGGARGTYHEGTWPRSAVRPKLGWTVDRSELESPDAVTLEAATSER